MTSADALSAVREEFIASGFDLGSDLALSELASVGARLALDAKSLVNTWELFDRNVLSRDGIDVQSRHVVGVERVQAFEEYAERAAQTRTEKPGRESEFGARRRAKRAGQSPSALGRASQSPGGSESKRASIGSIGTAVTPMKSAREWSAELDALTGGEPSEYARRAATPGSASAGAGADGAQTSTLNAHLPTKIERRSGEIADEASIVVLAKSTVSNPEKFRYMRDRISDRVRMIDARIRDVETRFDVAGDDEMDDGSAASASRHVFVSPVGSKTGDEDGYFVGRVVSAHNIEGKLTDKTVAIEGSIEGSFGARVRLELRELSEYSLFPGQVVKVRGRNPAGHCLVANAVDTGAATKPAAQSKKTDPVFTRGVEIVIASGPFSCGTDLRYEPLEDLLDYARGEKPDVLVLCGPLLDTENALVKSGYLGASLTYEQVVKIVIGKIEEKLATPTTKVIFVPSIRDVTLDPVFPQPAAEVADFVSDPSRVISVSNPGTFEVNGVVFSVCSHDVLKHLSAREISEGCAAKDRLARLAGHVVRQANAYPLYPPDVTACLDARHGEALTLDRTPDVLILPSDLKAFAETIEGDVVCVNPGRLARGNIGGTLAKMVIHPLAEADASNDESLHPHDVHHRCRIDVLKIK